MTSAEFQARHSPKKQKYGNKKKMIDGIEFDSTREARRWQDLVLMQHAGHITDLRRQVPFECRVGKVYIGKWIADFTYTTKDGTKITEDSKGFKNPLYAWKKKHVEAQYSIKILET